MGCPRNASTRTGIVRRYWSGSGSSIRAEVAQNEAARLPGRKRSHRVFHYAKPKRSRHHWRPQPDNYGTAPSEHQMNEALFRMDHLVEP
jgi:hypothetical protein